MKDKPVILVVDDQPQNIDLLKAYLVPEGYEIVTAANGKEALGKLSGNQIDLMLLDVMMPGIDGFEVTRRVRQDKTHRLLPIILVTALRATEDRVRGIEAGCDDFISKPIDKVELLARVRSLLKIKVYNDLLMKSEERYRRVFETASDGIVLLDKREGKIAHVNPASEKLLGYTQKESIGNKLQDIGVSLDMEDFQTTMQTLNKIGIINYNDVPVKTKSGRHIDTEVYLVDRARLAQCNIRDITDRKQAERQLKVSEDKYRSIVENAVEGIFQTTPEGRCISANPALVKMLWYDTPEELTEKVTDISKQGYVNSEDRVRYLKLLDEKGTFQGFETQFYRKDGSIIWVSINGRAVRDPTGKVLYYEGTMEDITARKTAVENLKQHAEKLRQSLLGTIKALSMTVEARDPYTSGHQTKVSLLAQAIAQDMALSNDTIDNIRIAGSIHDIGKISVPAEILSKPGKLTDLEFGLIKVHAQSGYNILKDAELPYPIAEIVLQHHERLNGSGYPQGLKNSQILLESQIIMVADVVEAMASHRPYRPALGINIALEEIEKNKGILYGAGVVDSCVRLFKERGFAFE